MRSQLTSVHLCSCYEQLNWVACGIRVLVPKARHWTAAKKKCQPCADSIYAHEDCVLSENVREYQGVANVEVYVASLSIPIKVHNEHEYQLCLPNRSKKRAMEIFNKPRAPIAEIMLCVKAI